MPTDWENLESVEGNMWRNSLKGMGLYFVFVLLPIIGIQWGGMVTFRDELRTAQRLEKTIMETQEHVAASFAAFNYSIKQFNDSVKQVEDDFKILTSNLTAKQIEQTQLIQWILDSNPNLKTERWLISLDGKINYLSSQLDNLKSKIK